MNLPPLDDELEALLGPERAMEEAPEGMREEVLASTLRAVGATPRYNAHDVSNDVDAGANAGRGSWTQGHAYVGVAGLVLGLIVGSLATLSLMDAPGHEDSNSPLGSTPLGSTSPIAPASEDTSSDDSAQASMAPVPQHLEQTPAPEPALRQAPPNEGRHAAAAVDATADAEEHDEVGEEAAARARAAERRLIDAARASLVRGNGAATLRTLTRYDSEFEHAQMREEASALKVRALVLLGRRTEAQHEASRFIDNFPQSPLRGAVEQSVAEVTR